MIESHFSKGLLEGLRRAAAALAVAALAVAAPLPAQDAATPVQRIEPEPVENPDVVTRANPARGVVVEAEAGQLGDRAACVRLVRRLRALNVTDIFVEAYVDGRAWYRSQYAPVPEDVVTDAFDPLGAVVELAHDPYERRMRVHATVSPLRAHRAPGAGPSTEALPEAARERLAAWRSKDWLGNVFDPQGTAWLDPAHPEAQQWLTALTGELAANYDLDGICFREFHYPSASRNWGYHPEALRLYQADLSGTVEKPAPEDEAWANWRADQLTGLLKTLGEAARERREGILISVEALATGPSPSRVAAGAPDYVRALQNWPLWAQTGMADWILLRNAHPQREEAQAFRDWIDFARERAGAAALIVEAAGSMNTDSDAAMQLRVALSREVEGVVLDSYQRPTRLGADDARFLDYLGRTVFSPDYAAPSYLTIGGRERPAPTYEEALSAVPEDEALPPPVALEPLDEEIPPERSVSPGVRPTQADLTRALLGGRAAEEVPRAGEAVDPVLLEAAEPRLPDGAWSAVTLSTGQEFEARELEAPEGKRRFQRRSDGVVVTLPAARVAAVEPIGDAVTP